MEKINLNIRKNSDSTLQWISSDVFKYFYGESSDAVYMPHVRPTINPQTTKEDVLQYLPSGLGIFSSLTWAAAMQHEEK